MITIVTESNRFPVRGPSYGKERDSKSVIYMRTMPKAGLLGRSAKPFWPDKRYAVIVVRKDTLYVVSLFVLGLLLFFWRLDGLKIWDIDEGMHAVMAKNMVLTGDWITPVFNGQPFFDKPALFNWLGALSFYIFGFTEFAARFPVALLGLGCILTTFLIGRRLFDSETGLLAGLILATTLEFIVLSRQVQYDVPFAFFTTLALYFFCAAYMDTYRRSLNVTLFWMVAALAVLTKGPLGLLLPGAAIVIFLVQQRRLNFLVETSHTGGVLLFTLMIVPWYLMMEIRNPGYLHYFVMKQHFANALGELGQLHARHPRPYYYYLPILIAGLFPWSILLVGATRRALQGRDDQSLLLLIWIISIVLIFSLSTSKLSTYILPIFPAAALLIARYLVEMIPVPNLRQRRSLLVSSSLALLLVVTLTYFIIVHDPWRFWEEERGLQWAKFEFFTLLIAALTGTVFFSVLRRRYVTGLMSLAAIAPVLTFVAFFHIALDAEEFNSAASIGQRYDRMLAPGEKMVFSTRMLDSALFYSGREGIVLDTEQALERYLASDLPVYVLLNRISKTESTRFDGDYYVLHQDGNKAIVSNRPPDNSTAVSR